MSESDALSLEARVAALRQLSEDTGVRQHGLQRRFMREGLSGAGRRVFMNEAGDVRILAPDGAGFLPAFRDEESAAAALAQEVAETAGEDDLMDLTQQAEEDRAERQAEMGRDPSYRL